jgi:hypothetical protein
MLFSLIGSENSRPVCLCRIISVNSGSEKFDGEKLFPQNDIDEFILNFYAGRGVLPVNC